MASGCGPEQRGSIPRGSPSSRGCSLAAKASVSKTVIAGSSPATLATFKTGRERPFVRTDSPIGRDSGLRSRVLGVRITLGAPTKGCSQPSSRKNARVAKSAKAASSKDAHLRVRIPPRVPGRSIGTSDWNWRSVLILNQEYAGSSPASSTTHVYPNWQRDPLEKRLSGRSSRPTCTNKNKPCDAAGVATRLSTGRAGIKTPARRHIGVAQSSLQDLREDGT